MEIMAANGGKWLMDNFRISLRTISLVAASVVFAALPARAATAADTKSLYERLGGYDGVSAVVDQFADTLFADKRISQFFVGMSDDPGRADGHNWSPAVRRWRSSMARGGYLWDSLDD
jgi:hypothetical protein